MISIIVPAFNEEKNITKTIKHIKNACNSININYEIIVVNDNSTDETLKKILFLKKKIRNIKVYNNKFNLGFGASFKKGLFKSKGSHIIMVQGDNAWPFTMLKKILTLHKKQKKSLIIQTNSKMLRERGFFRWLISKIFTNLLNIITNNKILYYNGLQVHKRMFLKKIKIKENHYCFQAEILLKSMKYYKNIEYIDLQSQNRNAGFSKAFQIKNIISTLIFIFNARAF